MKKQFYVPILFLLTLLLSSCWLLVDRTVVEEPAYYFICEFEIVNNSQADIDISCETAAFVSTQAMMMEDSVSVSVGKNATEILKHVNEVGLCGAPRLSFVLRIGGNMFAGFDSSTKSLCDYSWNEIEKVNAMQYSLGLVDWTASEKNPVWISSFSGYEERGVQLGVTARYKIQIAQDGVVSIELVSLENQ